MAKDKSKKMKTYKDYGWKADNLNSSGVKQKLEKILLLNKSNNFIFTDKDNLKYNFEMLNLIYPLENFDEEMAVIGITSGSGNYDKLFARIRNCLAHGGFIFKYNSMNEVVLIMEDYDQHNVSARMVIKLDTLIKIAKTINKNNKFVNYRDNELLESPNSNNIDDINLVLS